MLRGSKEEATDAFFHMASEVPSSHQVCHILFVRSKSLSPHVGGVELGSTFWREELKGICGHIFKPLQ